MSQWSLDTIAVLGCTSYPVSVCFRNLIHDASTVLPLERDGCWVLLPLFLFDEVVLLHVCCIIRSSGKLHKTSRFLGVVSVTDLLKRQIPVPVAVSV